MKQLACAHRIVSDPMAAARALIPAGTYRFGVGVGERMTAIEFQVEPADRDADVIQAVAAAIEAAATGAIAHIETTTGRHGDEYVRLNLTSRSSGTRGAIVTADLSRNLMVLMGLAASGWADERKGGTATAARDAVFQIDGEPFTAPANRVYLERERIFLALHQRGKATLSIRHGMPAVASLLAEWARAVGSVTEIAAQPSVRALLDPPGDLLGILSSLRSDFAACGILISGDQAPEVRPDLVAQGLETAAERFFERICGPDGGLAAVVLAAAQRDQAVCRRARAALQQQADWYGRLPSQLAARRLASQAVAAYYPSALRVAPAE